MLRAHFFYLVWNKLSEVIENIGIRWCVTLTHLDNDAKNETRNLDTINPYPAFCNPENTRRRFLKSPGFVSGYEFQSYAIAQLSLLPWDDFRWDNKDI